MGRIPQSVESISNAHAPDPDRINRLYTAIRAQQDWENRIVRWNIHPAHNGWARDPTSWGANDDRFTIFKGIDALASAHFYIPPEVLPVGKRIRSWEVVANQVSTTQMTFALFRISLVDGTQTQVGATIQPSAAAQDGFVYGDATDHTILANNAYYIHCQSAKASDEIRSVRILFDNGAITPVVELGLADGDNFTAAQLNDLQDAVVQLDGRKFGTFNHAIGVGMMRVFAYATDPPTIHPGFKYFIPPAATGQDRKITASIPLALGDQIDSWTAFIAEGATEVTSGRLWKVDLSDGTRVQIGSTQTSGTGGGNLTIGQSGLAENHVAGFAYHLQIHFENTGDTGRRIYGWTYTRKRNRSR